MAEFQFKKEGTYLRHSYQIIIAPERPIFPEASTKHIYQVYIDGQQEAFSDLTTDQLQHLDAFEASVKRRIEALFFDNDLQDPLRKLLVERGYMPEPKTIQ